MKERPILYSAPMALARIAGLKRQTRRIVKLPSWVPDQDVAIYNLREQCKAGKHAGIALFEDGRPVRRFVCPFGGVGDRLWGRETWRPVMESGRSFIEYAADNASLPVDRGQLAGQRKVALRFPGARAEVHSENWHPSIFMPRWASRMLDEITEVRIERVQSITDADAIAEGVESWAASDDGMQMLRELGFAVPTRPRFLFKLLWSKINGAESWEANPFAWCISFRPVMP